MNTQTKMAMTRVPVITEAKPYTVKALCGLYGVSDKTLRKWLKPLQAELGQRQGHLYTVRQVRIIFKKLGVPAKIE